jgi:DNA replication protein DnaC
VKKPDSMIEISKTEWEANDARVRASKTAKAEADRREEFRAFRERLTRWGVPEKDTKAILGKMLDSGDAMRAVRNHREGILVLAGPPGSGKTTAAGFWCAFCQSPTSKLLSRRPVFPPLFLKAAWLARTNRYDHGAMMRIERARMFVLDDLGTEYRDEKGSFQATLDTVLDARYDNRLPTIITTNSNVAQFKIDYGERIADRIREAGKFINCLDRFRPGEAK